MAARPRAAGVAFTDWVKTLFAIRGRPDGGMSAEQTAPIHEAIAEAQASGTVAVGDISNSLAAVGSDAPGRSRRRDFS